MGLISSSISLLTSLIILLPNFLQSFLVSQSFLFKLFFLDAFFFLSFLPELLFFSSLLLFSSLSALIWLSIQDQSSKVSWPDVVPHLTVHLLVYKNFEARQGKDLLFPWLTRFTLQQSQILKNLKPHEGPQINRPQKRKIIPVMGWVFVENALFSSCWLHKWIFFLTLARRSTSTA